MDDPQSEAQNTWTEDVSRKFIDFGYIFVPDRDEQFQVITSLLAGLPAQAAILELCCGEGLLAEKVLTSYPNCHVTALDGSQEMLRRARARLARFEARAKLGAFNLAAPDWRDPQSQFDGVVSSLAIHHLPGLEKRSLFKRIYQMLNPGGVLVVADVLEVVGEAAKKQAADQMDEIVRRQSLEQTGGLDAYNFFIREGWNTFRYLDPEDIDKPSPLLDQLKWMEEVGFGEVNVCWLRAGHAIFCGRRND